MAEVGSAFVSILPSAKGFGKKLSSQVEPETKKTGSKLGSSLGKAFAIAGGAAAAVGFIKGSIGEARDAQKVGALTAQVIKSTGGAANVTARQVAGLSDAISKKVGVDDEVIQSGANMLLTFRNIRNEAGKGNDVFNQSTKTLIDMSAALGKDPKSAAIQLGKALNDPIKGITALGRAGVQFNDQQKKQIKTMVESGNRMGAQKIILRELNKEFGGAAAAQATAGDKAKVAFQNLQETVGTALLPLLDRLSTWFTSKAAPAISTFVTGMQKGTGAGGQFAAVIQRVVSVGGSIIGFLNQHRSALVALVAVYAAYRAAAIAYNVTQIISLALLKAHTVGTMEYAVVSKVAALGTKIWAAGQWLLNAALTANPIGLIVVAIAALVVGLVLAYKHSETFRNIVNGAFLAVVAAGKFMWGALKGYFRLVASVWLTVAGVIIHGAAKAFGWIPGIGKKIKGLAAGFDRFKADVNRALGGIHDKKIKVTAETGAASAALAGIQRQMNALDGAHATVSVGKVGKNARGTDFWRGGPTWVGERGPEIVNLPRGARVTPNNEIAAGGGGAAVFHIYDSDRRLIGTMRGVADGSVRAHAGVSSESFRSKRGARR